MNDYTGGFACFSSLSFYIRDIFNMSYCEWANKNIENHPWWPVEILFASLHEDAAAAASQRHMDEKLILLSWSPRHSFYLNLTNRLY